MEGGNSRLAPGAATRAANAENAEIKDAEMRSRLAAWCRGLGDQLRGQAASTKPKDDPAAGLTPRVRQTLERLLAGDSEKEIARHLGLSPHTVHVYVKTIYKHLNVCSRGELHSRFVDAAYRAAKPKS